MSTSLTGNTPNSSFTFVAYLFVAANIYNIT